MVIDATRIFRCPYSFVSVKQAGVLLLACRPASIEQGL